MDGNLLDFLEEKYVRFNHLDFIDDDPICIPHRFSDPRDIEIAGFFAAVLAWGQRKTIINKCSELMGMMDNSPSDFIINHSESELKVFLNFKHRTFNSTDALYFFYFLKHVYQTFGTLENAFWHHMKKDNLTIEDALNGFRKLFFGLPEFPHRTGKHISSPDRKSACKRLNMFFRWMVRKDNSGVDFGIWSKFKPSQLISPCDVHVEKVARRLGLIKRKQMDWLAAVELTENLKKFDSSDPVKYDFALFGIGLEEKEKYQLAG